MTLAYLEVADDELIGLRCRAANRALANLFAPYRDRTHRRRAGPDARSEARGRRARVRGARAGLQDRGVRRPRPPPDRRRRRLPARHVRRRQRVRLRPALGQVRRARRRAGVPQLAAIAPRHALGDELRVQPHRRARRRATSRCASRCSSPASRTGSRRCASASSKAASPGRAACSAISSAIGRSATPRRSARSIPTCSMSTRCSRSSSATATTASARASPSCARTSRGRARVPSSSTSSRRRRSTRSPTSATASCRTSTSAAKPTTGSSRGRSPSTSTRAVRGCGRSSARDISHWDVPDMTEPVEEAYELVEDGVIGEREFRELMFLNPARLHAGMNPEFFAGTASGEADPVVQLCAPAWRPTATDSRRASRCVRSVRTRSARSLCSRHRVRGCVSM